MKKFLLGISMSFLAGELAAQSQLTTASPIPDGAEKRFCYYQGLVYSENAFILLVGTNTVTSTAPQKEERLLRCFRGDDGNLSWRPQSTLQLGK